MMDNVKLSWPLALLNKKFFPNNRRGFAGKIVQGSGIDFFPVENWKEAAKQYQEYEKKYQFPQRRKPKLK